MSATSLGLLAGLETVDDGSCTSGAIPVYKSDGSIPQNSPSKPSSGLGGQVYYFALTDSARNDDGSVVDATGASGKFHFSNTTGISMVVISAAANNSTATCKLILERTVPGYYNAGDAITVTLNGLYAANSGTVTTKTILAKLFKLAKDGTSGSDLIGASAATLTTSAADYTFVLASPSGLSPGDRILVQVTGVITETAAGGNSTITLNSVRLS